MSARMVPCENCGNPIWPESAPLCDTCRNLKAAEDAEPKAEKPKAKPKAAAVKEDEIEHEPTPEPAHGPSSGIHISFGSKDKND